MCEYGGSVGNNMYRGVISEKQQSYAITIANVMSNHAYMGRSFILNFDKKILCAKTNNDNIN